MKKNAVFMLALCLLVSLATPALGASEVEYLPGVTEEMCSPEFWTAMMEDPDALRTSPALTGRPWIPRAAICTT